MNDPLAEFPVVQRIAIAYADMDTRRHVNNVTYYRYMESARIAYYERIGRYRFEQESGIVLVVAENGCRYKRSLTYPGDVLVGVRVSEFGTDRATMRYRLVDAAGRWIAAEGFAVSVALDTRTGRKTAYPDVLKQRIRALQGEIE